MKWPNDLKLTDAPVGQHPAQGAGNSENAAPNVEAKGAFGAAPCSARLDLNEHEWQYKNLMEAIDLSIQKHLEKAEILREMRKVIPVGKTKEYYETVFGTTPVYQR